MRGLSSEALSPRRSIGSRRRVEVGVVVVVVVIVVVVVVAAAGVVVVVVLAAVVAEVAAVLVAIAVARVSRFRHLLPWHG